MSGLMLAFVAIGQGTELTLVIIALLVALVLLVADAMSRQKRRRSRFPFRLLRFDQQKPDLTDVGQQLRAVMAGSFEKQRVLSSSEYRVFAIIESEIAAQRAGYRVFAQTSLGEILKSSNQDAFHSINSKRVDILVVDRSGWPFLAVEYQGDNHYQGTAAARDAVKKEALRKAGVRYMEFCATDTDDQIRSRVREYFAIKVAGSAKNSR
jgi:Protein of unknown function (DUF2726)